MKKIAFTLVFNLVILISFSQNFSWVKGPNTGGATGTYGTMGVSAASNNPGARHGCGKWVDANGNLWLFGGEGYSNSSTVCWMNDLWKYNPSNNEWTWVRGSNGPNSTGSYGTMGVASPSNDPPAREFMACWTDASGNFWMFGGDGSVSSSTITAPEKLGDLWKYNPSTNQWTWVKGYNTAGQSGVYGTAGIPALTNLPGGRMGSGAWTDAAGDLWMFGGLGFGSGAFNGYLNDLWKYNITSNQWTWMGGANIVGQYGLYGTLGVPSTTNAPGGRFLPNCFTDGNGNFYLFGGRGFGIFVSSSVSNNDYLNDLWKYNTSTGTWTWIHGSNIINTAGIYGTLGVSSPSNAPGGRRASACWEDASGNFWMFGGRGVATANNLGELNDLFRYNPGVNEWTWIKGANVEDQNGTYGTLGVPAAANIPGAREYNTWWKGPNSVFWLFGGEGLDVSSSSGDHMSDLWKYYVPCNPDSILVTPGKTICSGQSVTLTALHGGPGVNWYSSLTSTNSIGSGTVLSASNLTTSSASQVYDYFAESNFCTAEARAAISITVNALPTLTAVSNQTIACKDYPVTLSVSGANSYTWNTIPAQTSSLITFVAVNSVTYTAIGTAVNGCTNSISFPVKVVTCPGIYENTNQNEVHSVYPNPNNGQFTLDLLGTQKNEELTIFNALGQKVYEKSIKDLTTHVESELSNGIYFYQVKRGTKIVASGKLIIN